MRDCLEYISLSKRVLRKIAKEKTGSSSVFHNAFGIFCPFHLKVKARFIVFLTAAILFSHLNNKTAVN
jgi:hypothetical protein